MPDPRLLKPPRSVNDAIADRIIRHAIYIERLKTHQVRLIIGEFNEGLAFEIAAQIERSVGSILSGPYLSGLATTNRLRGLAARNAKLIAEQMDTLLKLLVADLELLAGVDAAWAAKMLGETVPLAFDFRTPAPATLRSIVRSRPFDGALLKDWWRGLSTATQDGVGRELTRGLVLGEPTQVIVRRIRGTRANGFADGYLQTPRRQIEAVVRTAVSHVTNQARAETYKANADVVQRERWVSTLDADTTEICMALDGRVFPVGEGQFPPAHHQCRSVRTPITASFAELGRELGIDLEDIAPGTRASMDGQVPADMTYGSWLRRQSAAFQDQVLGPGKAAVFRRGKVDIGRFVTRDLRPLTLRELQALEGMI